MQKFLWGGAVLIILGAAAAYLAVDYAMRNPASMVARYGIAVVSAGLNSNPLTAINPAVSGARTAARGGRTVIPANITIIKSENVANPDCDNDPYETIEPIQVECVPPATAEPPTQAEESEWMGEWKPLFENQGEEALDQPEKPMPDADVDTSKTDTPELRCRGLGISQVLDLLRETGGCLNWFEFSAPEQIPVMPRVQTQGGEEESEQLADPEWDGNEHQGCGCRCHHGCQGKNCPTSGSSCPGCEQGSPELIQVMPMSQKPASGEESEESNNPECGGGCNQGCGGGSRQGDNQAEIEKFAGQARQLMHDGKFEEAQKAWLMVQDLDCDNIAAQIGVFECHIKQREKSNCAREQTSEMSTVEGSLDGAEQQNSPRCEGGCNPRCGRGRRHGYNHGRGQEDANPNSSEWRTPIDDMVSFNGAQAVGSDAIRVTHLLPAITQSELIPMMPLPKKSGSVEESEELSNPPCEPGCNQGCGRGRHHGYSNGRGKEDADPTSSERTVPNDQNNNSNSATGSSNADDMVNFIGAGVLDACRGTCGSCACPAQCLPEQVPVMPLPKSTAGEEESEELNNPPTASGRNHGWGWDHGYNEGRGEEDARPSWRTWRTTNHDGCGNCEGVCDYRCGGWWHAYRRARAEEDVCPDSTPTNCSNDGTCQCGFRRHGVDINPGQIVSYPCQSGCTSACQCEGTCECSPCKCGPTGTCGKSCVSDTAPTGQPCEIFTCWDRTPQMITVSPDPEHEGVATPHLVGWVMLFDSETKPVCCEGTVRVTLIDADNEAQLAEWTFDGEMLQPEKDPFGFWGYKLQVPLAAPCTACCPLGCTHGCHSNAFLTSEVRVEVEFTPQDGTPLRRTTGAMQMSSPTDGETKAQTEGQCEGGCHGNCNGCGQEDVGSCCPRHVGGQKMEVDSHLTPDCVDGGIAPRTPGSSLDCSDEQSGCTNGCHKTCRKTEVVQLYHAKAQDVVTAIQTYIDNLCSTYTTCQTNIFEPLQRDLVLVAEPEGNKVLINVSADWYGELIDMIREIDGQASHESPDDGK